MSQSWCILSTLLIRLEMSKFKGLACADSLRARAKTIRYRDSGLVVLLTLPIGLLIVVHAAVASNISDML